MIKVRAGGPYKVTGPVTLTDADGNPLPTPEGSLVLCRCGRSRTKPYCDRSHRTAPGSTAAVHAGLPAGRDGEPYLPGPVFAAPYHFAGDPEGRDEPHYGRAGQPHLGTLGAARSASSRAARPSRSRRAWRRSAPCC